MLLIQLLPIGAIGVSFWPGRPHALLKDVFEVKFEVELQKFWFLLQACVLFLLPRASFEDEGIEAEDAHHLLHILCRMSSA